MIDPDTPKALKAIASMMRMEGYKPDAFGIEALVLDNAADEIERLKAITWAQAGEIDRLAAENDRLTNNVAALQSRLYLNNINHNIEE